MSGQDNFGYEIGADDEAVLRDIHQMTEANAKQEHKTFTVPAQRLEKYRSTYDAVTLSPFVTIKTD